MNTTSPRLRMIHSFTAVGQYVKPQQLWLTLENEAVLIGLSRSIADPCQN